MTDAINPGDRYILLVEDNPDDSALTLRALKRHNIVNPIKLVRDGVEAVEFLFARGEFELRDAWHVPALVLLDISMPRMNGHEVLAAMRADERTRNVPVVILTSSDEQTDLVQAYAHGVNSYVRKPVEFAEFLEAVGKLGVYWMLLNLAPAESGEGYGH